MKAVIPSADRLNTFAVGVSMPACFVSTSLNSKFLSGGLLGRAKLSDLVIVVFISAD
jgi:hypothetical protein